VALVVWNSIMPLCELDRQFARGVTDGSRTAANYSDHRGSKRLARFGDTRTTTLLISTTLLPREPGVDLMREVPSMDSMIGNSGEGLRGALR
jgi:hypothetical protein